MISEASKSRGRSHTLRYWEEELDLPVKRNERETASIIRF